MKLKKINEALRQALSEQGLEHPTDLQRRTFGRIKSGVDTLLIAPSVQGKTLAQSIAAIQRVEKPLEARIATQVLVVVRDKEAVESLLELYGRINVRNNLRVYGVHERTDIDEDKNLLSLGNDILIGTAERLNEFFSSAGFDVNQLKMYIVDDLDVQLRSRLEPRLYRLSESIGKTQRLYLTTAYDDRVDAFVAKTMNEDFELFDFSEE